MRMKSDNYIDFLRHALFNGNGIAKRLIVALIIYSTIITTIITGIQLYGEYKSDLGLIDSSFKFIQESFTPVLADSVWVDDDIQIKTQLAGLLNLRDMEYLAIKVDKNTRWEQGELTSEKVMSQTIPLHHEYRGRDIIIGELYMVASVENVQSRLFRKLIVLLVENGIKTLLIVLFVLLLFQLMVTRHLAALSRYARETSPRHLDREDLVLDRPRAGYWRPDALDHLTNALNTMRHNLLSAYAEMSVTNRRLQESEERLRLALSVANGGVWDWSVPEGNVFFSPGWAAMLGYEPREVEPEYAFFEASLHPDDKARARENMLALTDGQVNSCSAEYRLLTRSGTWLWVLCQAQVTRWAEFGKALRVVGTMVSIDDKKRAELQLLELNEELEQRVRERTSDLVQALNQAEEASKAKTQFLSRMSHELRTPLNAILGYTQLLLGDVEKNLTPDQKVQLEEMLNSGDHLLSLINELLDLARIESGRIDINIQPVDPVPVIYDCIEMMKPLAGKRKIEMSVEVDEYAPALADEQRLRQVLINLLSNAVKYSRPSGAIIVKCHNTLEGYVRVEVHDQGAGIASEDLSRLFKPFERLESNTIGIEGTGVGLALCKRLIEAMHGTIGVESVPGDGSVFWIELPTQ